MITFPHSQSSLKFAEESSHLAVGTGRRKPMDPIIQVRDVSHGNGLPTKLFSTNIEINKTGHKMYYPSETHTKYSLVRKFGEDIGSLMHFLLKFPDLDHIYITSYSICVALKHHVNIKDWSPTIDKMVNLAINSLARKQVEESVVIQVKVAKNDLPRRWFTDLDKIYFTGTLGSRFWRPYRLTSQKYLKELGEPWTKIVPSILRITGVEEIEPFYGSFLLNIGDVYIPRWDTIDEQILSILRGAFHQNVIFKYVKS